METLATKAAFVSFLVRMDPHMAPYTVAIFETGRAIRLVAPVRSLLLFVLRFVLVEKFNCCERHETIFALPFAEVLVDILK